MACITIGDGLFISNSWQNPNSTTTLPNGTIITSANGGPNPGVFISKSGSPNKNFPKPSSGSVEFINFGTPKNYVLVLTIQDGGGGVHTRSVVLVDTSGSNLNSKLLLTINSASSNDLPEVKTSQGGGHVFLLYGAVFSGGISGSQICLSQDGTTLCSEPPFSPTLEITGEAQGDSLRIKHGGTILDICDKPQPDCDVIPPSKTFNDVIIGADIPGLDTQTESFKIENNGDNCLQVNSISSSGPFTPLPTTPPMPLSLDPGKYLDVTVRFSSATEGNFNEDLPINPAPPKGDVHLNCKGEAKNAELKMTFSGSASFGKFPVGTTTSKTIQIKNEGQIIINLNIPASTPADLPFSWSNFSGSLAPNSPTMNHSLVINFNPLTEGSFNDNITFTSNTSGSPHNISLSGIGCVPNAEMSIQVPNPMDPYIDFSDVQQGFRMVRTIKVFNSGDGSLNFSARIEGIDATLFGIQKEGTSIINPPANQTFNNVLPTNSCGGSSGSGKVIFGIAFFANDAPPKIAQAQLIIYNHNATNIAQPEISYDLQAEIVAAVSVDVELVLDRSGSMGDDSGDRTKIETAISAGQLFVELMRPNVQDRVGIVKFNNNPEVVSSIQNVSSANQNTIKAQINPTSFNATGSTSIAGGVRVAIKDIDDNPRSSTPSGGLNTLVVVLTDGMDNVPYDDPDGNTYSLLGGPVQSFGTWPFGSTIVNTLALPVPADKKIYAVGIGDNINDAKLSVLAQATGGEYLHIHNFSGTDFFALEKHFTQIFMEAVDLAVISDPVFTIQPNDKHTIPIDILDGDTSLMVVVYDRENIRLPFYLETPNGEIVELNTTPSGFQIRPGITSTARFLEVKFPSNEPERYGGQWKFVIKHDGRACYYEASQNNFNVSHEVSSISNNVFGFGFQPTKCESGYTKPIMYGMAVGVGSDFRMFPFVQPGIIKVGESIKLNAIVNEFGLPVIGCSVTVKVEAPDGTIYNFALLDDGNHEDDEKNDGNYGRGFSNTNDEGFYTFTFRALGYSHDNQPVMREAVRSKYVEGIEPLKPNDNGNPGGFIKECCRKLSYFFIILIILLLIIIIKMWFR